MDRNALAEFLVRHRSALRPDDVGMVAGPRRRAAGLRREEVAQLAAMSTDYYARLEQRRGPQPSAQMLAALARALRLTSDERDYLFRVAGQSAPDRVAVAHVAPPLLRVLDRLADSPAMILSSLGEVLAQNDLARALFGDTEHLRGFERSTVYRWFVHPEDERWRYPAADRARQSRSLVASLRAAYGAAGRDSATGELVQELTARSPEFAELWGRQEVARRYEDHKVLVHPEVGEIEVWCQALFTEDQSQTLLVLSAAPGSESEGKISLLRVVGAQGFASER